MRELNYQKQLIICGFLFTIHNLEESIGYAFFTFPEGVKLPFSTPTTVQMTGAIIALTIIACFFLLIAYSSKRDYFKRDILAIITTVFLINSIFPHILSAIVLLRYTPAVATSALLYLPYTVLLLPKLYRAYHPKARYFKLVICGLIFTGMLTVGLQMMMKQLFH